MVGLRTSSAIASPSTLSSSDDEIGTLVECDQSDAQSQEIVEFEPAEPDVPLESQATVILPYGADNDDNIHAFEYEGLLSDGVISHRPVVLRRDHRPVVGKVDETNEQRDTGNGAEGAVTSPRGLASKKDTAIVDLGPPPSAQTVTPRTVIQPEPAVPLSPTVLPRLEETIEHQERHASRCTLPSRSEDPNVVTGAAGQLEPVKSPTQLDVAVAVKSSSSRESRAGATAATSHGYKRRQQKEISFSPKGRPVSQLKMQKDDESSSRMQKRRRRNVLLTRTHHGPSLVSLSNHTS
ncbi:unnamed protein product [Hyaloperonospora brassicae]|nr:unnamed protein product [Hyaloperonospora brassicae]